MESNTLDNLIEAVLFMKGEPQTMKELSALVKVPMESVEESLGRLAAALQSRGIRLVRKDDEVTLATSPEFGEFFRELQKAEQAKDLGKAGLETLSIVLYHGPVSKSRIEYIRGVNSSFVLRTLLIRGLIERVSNPEDQRSYLYRPTFDALSHLGITNVEELPEYDSIKKEIVAAIEPEAQVEPDEFEDESH